MTARLIGGLATFDGRTVMVLGHQKGSDTKENIARNFGMARPEGYRKAERLMRHAEKFGFPVVTFIDTPGAEPGIGSEERGQATAIAESLLAMADLGVPTVAVIIGEGGSGGALAIGVADRMLMLENAVYAVASPEACAAILWKDAGARPRRPKRCASPQPIWPGSASSTKSSPEHVPAHQGPREAIRATGEAIARHLARTHDRAYPRTDSSARSTACARRATSDFGGSAPGARRLALGWGSTAVSSPSPPPLSHPPPPPSSLSRGGLNRRRWQCFGQTSM